MKIQNKKLYSRLIKILTVPILYIQKSQSYIIRIVIIVIQSSLKVIRMNKWEQINKMIEQIYIITPDCNLNKLPKRKSQQCFCCLSLYFIQLGSLKMILKNFYIFELFILSYCQSNIKQYVKENKKVCILNEMSVKY
ncbi:hypothetical protein pb186bvf_002144 [Paramecium bursaria]